MSKQGFEALDAIRKAREGYLSRGVVPAGMVSEIILRSWQRSADRGVGSGQGADRCMPHPDLLQRLEKNRAFVHCSQPIMENLYQEIAGTSSIVVLTDNEGMVLRSVGDPDFVKKAQKVYLKPGGIWSEDVNGTNAIGTALEDQIPVQVYSSEHYLSKNRFLTCSATPVFDPRGALLGILDVSGDYRAHQKHTLALVRLSAQMIENQMFVLQFPEELIISFHIRPEFIGTLYEGIAVFAPDGRFVAANRGALLQLGLDRSRMIGRSFSGIFGISLSALLEQTRRVPQPVLKLPLHSGAEVYGRAWCGRTGSPVALFPPRAKLPEFTTPTPAKTLSAGVPLTGLELGDPAMRAVINKALKVLGHDIPILIEGESGTGKELLARGLHLAGPRRAGPFVPINCAAIPEGLFESELFGYQEGAFTGARRQGNIGKIREADNGTLFLDEIGEMPLNLQARLLRVLQDRTVSPLGGAGGYRVNIAVICAANKRLRDAVVAGRFREDLYYRLNGLLLTLPSLRERQDRVALCRSILNDLAGGDKQIKINEEVLRIFELHPWPGNIRQMHGVLRTAVALRGDSAEITVADLPEDFLEQSGYHAARAEGAPVLQVSKPGNALLAAMETHMISATLAQAGGNIAAAARKLGISRTTLYRKLPRAPGQRSEAKSR
jgi:transcriptional regulator of acetoin/glycerol metabolism